jgi:uncharacterized protein (DUF362 family)
MSSLLADTLKDSRVAVARSPEPGYRDRPVAESIARIARNLGWSDQKGGPFGNIIPEGSRVLIKPNFVTHENQGPWGIEPLITHERLVRATVEAALQSEAAQVLVGDAPIQECRFDELLTLTGLGQWASDLAHKEPRFLGIEDFRRTTCEFVGGVRVAAENLVAENRFVLFDLGADSLLEAVTDKEPSFRVTCYDPRLLANTHSSSRHQYLVAREVIEADVIINLPKLKTHKKAGMTCALKNLIGINGNKEYLPHHRVGGSESGGDCYPGGSRVKRALEYTLDRQNMASSFTAARVWSEVATNLTRISALGGDRLGVEGSWSGNDTIWRTALDLNRVLLYGRENASLADVPQRRLVHVVDAVVAGQGDGPLRPMPLPLGLIFGGANAAAVDWVGACLLGFDPKRISIARESFGGFRWPIAEFTPDEVTMSGDLGEGNAGEVLAQCERQIDVIHPEGWRDAAVRSAS